MHRVFVYGTLKRGQRNNEWLTNPAHGASQFVYAATTRDPYPLIAYPPFSIPFLLDAINHPNAKRVHGEIYDVSDAMLASLDMLEFEGDWYRRSPIDVVRTSDGTTTTSCMTYMLCDFDSRLLKMNFIDSYDEAKEPVLRSRQPSQIVDVMMETRKGRLGEDATDVRRNLSERMEALLRKIEKK